MTIIAYVGCGVALLCAALVITRRNAMHAMLYLVVMLLALALVFFALGAPFVAALQVIIYAGAIMVLFLFVVMILNLGRPGERQERGWLSVAVWAPPTALTALLIGLSAYALAAMGEARAVAGEVPPRQVGLALFREYALAAELASFVLLAGLIAAIHLAPPPREDVPQRAPAPGETVVEEGVGE
jgi:NADH-quinone oxidoreductase subunit J